MTGDSLRRRKRAWLAVAVGFVLLLVGLFVYPCFPHRYFNPVSFSLSNVKQQSIALSMYAADWDGRQPSALAWMDACRPYFRSGSETGPLRDEVFIDPNLDNRKENEFGYAFFQPLSGVDTALVDDPVHAPLTFQSKDLSWNAHGTLDLLPYRIRKMRGNVVSFMDGHAMFMPDSWRFETIVIVIAPSKKENNDAK